MNVCCYLLTCLEGRHQSFRAFAENFDREPPIEIIYGAGGTDAVAMIMGEVKLVGQAGEDTRFSDVHDEWLSGMAWHGMGHPRHATPRPPLNHELQQKPSPGRQARKDRAVPPYSLLILCKPLDPLWCRRSAKTRLCCKNPSLVLI